jgi:hypothetical protein
MWQPSLSIIEAGHYRCPPILMITTTVRGVNVADVAVEPPSVSFVAARSFPLSPPLSVVLLWQLLLPIIVGGHVAARSFS